MSGAPASTPATRVPRPPESPRRTAAESTWEPTAEPSKPTESTGHAIYHVNVGTGRDSHDGRSQTRAFASIQAAIDAARDGDTILVWPGVYREEITFEGKAITVQSAADAAVITAPNGYACSFYTGENAGSVLANFVITGCGKSGIFCSGASPTLKNLTIVKNQAGILAYGGADPTIVNCIIWANTNPVNSKNVSLSAWTAGYGWNASYSCIDAERHGQHRLERRQHQHGPAVRGFQERRLPSAIPVRPIRVVDRHMDARQRDEPLHRRRRPVRRSAQRAGGQRRPDQHGRLRRHPLRQQERRTVVPVTRGLENKLGFGKAEGDL